MLAHPDERPGALARGLAARSAHARPGRHAEPPAVIIRSKWFYGQGLEPPPQPGFEPLVTTPRWQIVTACGPASQLD